VAINLNQYERIRELYEQEHLSIREIAKTLNCSRDTVSKYVRGETVPWARQSGSGRKTVITESISRFIDECFAEDEREGLKKQKHTAKRIHDRIEDELGIQIAESTIRRFVAEKREKCSPAFVPLEYDPGEAFQIDWGGAKVYIGDDRVETNFFCMRECSSGAIFCVAYMRQNEESFLEGIQTGLEYFGGVPRRIIFDNAKVGVKEGFGHYAVAQERYAELAAHYAFKTVFCNPAEGHEKGLVENLVGYVRNNYMVPLPRVNSLKELNTILLSKCDKYNATHKISGRELKVSQMLETTRKCLIKLPPYRYDTSQTHKVTANDFSLIRFDYNKYSVPFRLSGKSVTVKGYALEVQLWYQNKLIASYDRCFQRNHTFYRLEHYMELLERRPRSVYNALPVRSTVPPALYHFLQELEEPKQVLRILRAYIANPSKVMRIIETSGNYEQALLELELPTNGSTSIQDEIKVSRPKLDQYDAFLQGRAV